MCAVLQGVARRPCAFRVLASSHRLRVISLERSSRTISEGFAVSFWFEGKPCVATQRPTLVVHDAAAEARDLREHFAPDT